MKDQVQVRVDGEDVDKLKHIAKVKKMTFPEHMREVIKNYLRRNWSSYKE